MADGSIMIETKLSTDKFDKQIVNLEKRIKEEENKSELKLKAKLQAEDELKRHKQAIFEIEQEYEKTSQQVEHLQSIMSKQSRGISLTPQEFTDLQGSEKVIANNEKIGETLDKMYAKEVKLNNAVDRTSLAYSQIQSNVSAYKAKIESVNIQKQQAQVDQLKNGFNKMNTSVSSSIKHIGRLALGIFSVASAYRLMSSASSTLGQYDEQYATNLEYIRYLIAQAIAPALKYVVNLASTLLSYLNYIANAWFGITLFSKNSSKNFMKARESTSKIKKDLQTTPFDEMNVLSDTSSSGTSGAVAPSIDPSLFEGKVPDWLKWIANNKNLILSVMAGITAGLLAWKLGLDGIKALGIGLMISGIVYAISSLLKYLKDRTWKNFGKIIQGVGIAIIGLGAIIGSVPVAVAGAIVLIVGTITKYWQQIKGFLQSGIDWLISKVDWVKDNFGLVGETIYTIFTSLLQGLLNIFDSLFTAIKGTFDGIIKFIKGAFSGDWKQAWEGIKDIFSSVWNGIKGIVSSVWQYIKSIFNSLVNLVKGIANTIWGVIKILINLIISGINVLIRGMNQLSFDAPDWVPGIGGKRWGVNIPQIPRLAKGTILNAPGRGVPVAGGTALAGEAGREAYLPLTDTQLLEELGSTIGKYINLNATIPIYVGNRQIAREIKRINAESDFAFNR